MTEKFQLLDGEGDPVVSGKDYYLRIVQTPNSDVEDSPDDGHVSAGLMDDVFSVVGGFFHATLGYGAKDDLVVRCSLEDGIAYLKHEGRYLCGDSQEGIYLTKDLPSKERRLQFVEVTDPANCYKVAMWDQQSYLTLEWIRFHMVRLYAGIRIPFTFI